eukprot:1156358-Pelagomonas_calceolata.AAC.3
MTAYITVDNTKGLSKHNSAEIRSNGRHQGRGGRSDKFRQRQTEGKYLHLTDQCTAVYILKRIATGPPKKWEKVFKAVMKPE